MKYSRRIVISGLASLAFVGFSPSYAQTQDQPAHKYSGAETAVLDAESARFDAQVKQNVQALNQAIVDDAIYIHANGQQQTKAEYLHDVEAGTSRYRAIEASDRSVQILGNMAVTHGTITLSVGVDRQIQGRYSGVYVQRDGLWQVISFQTTIVAPRQ